MLDGVWEDDTGGEILAENELSPSHEKDANFPAGILPYEDNEDDVRSDSFEAPITDSVTVPQIDEDVLTDSMILEWLERLK